MHWAGDPNKPAEAGPHGTRLTPRKSFEAWAELVKGRSTPFSPGVLRIAETLRSILIEVVLRLSEKMQAERRRAADRQDLLIAELNHRVRNILTLIGGLVRRSSVTERSVDDYAKEIGNRINALARAHDQITLRRWGAAPLKSLIEAEAEVFFADHAAHIELDGPEVLLLPHAFSTLALVIHELMTNSAKYGALSTNGCVAVQWLVDSREGLQISWREYGGPPVEVPSHQGFGTTLIRFSVPYDLGGEAEIEFKPSGVEARFSIASQHLAAVEPAATAATLPAVLKPLVLPAAASLPAESQPLLGHIVLLLEDSLIAAIDTEERLQRLGAAKVVLAASAQQALLEIDQQRPSLAVLDINLGGQTSFIVAEHLQRDGVPLMFATAYGDSAEVPEHLAATPLLQKPYTIEELAKVVTEVLGK